MGGMHYHRGRRKFTRAGIATRPRPNWFAMHEETNHRLNPLRSAPNLLTLLRICLAPFLVAAILEGHFLVSFSLFIVAGLTDALDGALARMLKQRSTFGQYLDPVADKLLLSTLFLVLLYKGLMPTTVTVLVFGRDVGILLVSALLYAAAGRREFDPSLWGKGNTLAQIAAVASVLLSQVTPGWHWVMLFRAAALGATMALTVVSGFHYAWSVSRRSGAPAGNGNHGGNHQGDK
jgi:cardiolipin synthase